MTLLVLLVRVLFDKASAVVLATRVSVVVGRVSVPELRIWPMVGVVKVLLVRV